MSKRSKKNKEKSIPLQNTPYTLPTPPFVSCGTQKQREVMLLISEGLNLHQISRRLSISVTSVRERLMQCKNKGFVNNESGSWFLTEQGKISLKKDQNDCKGGCKGSPLKSVHSNRFAVKITEFPNQWAFSHSVVENLKPKEFFYNKSTKSWRILFEDCTLVIYENKKHLEFFIEKQTGSSFDEICSKVWDVFVKYHSFLCSNGFRLDFRVETFSQHFADPNGFFAKLASVANSDGYKIETTQGDFWLDFSNGIRIPEEETDSEVVANRMEVLANSALNSKSDFMDLDKMRELMEINFKIVSGLVQLQAKQIMPNEGGNVDQTQETDYFG